MFTEVTPKTFIEIRQKNKVPFMLLLLWVIFTIAFVIDELRTIDMRARLDKLEAQCLQNKE